MSTDSSEHVPSEPKKGRKSWSTWKKVGVLAAALLVLAGAASMCSSSPDDKPTGAEHQGDSSNDPGIGSPVRDGKFEFTVHGLSRTSVAGDPSNEFLQEKAKGEFIGVSLSVTNVGDDPQSYFPSEQKLVVNGRQFNASNILLLSEDTGAINPGLSVDTTVYFDVPPGSVPEFIVLHDSAFSNGVKVSLGA